MVPAMFQSWSGWTVAVAATIGACVLSEEAKTAWDPTTSRPRPRMAKKVTRDRLTSAPRNPRRRLSSESATPAMCISPSQNVEDTENVTTAANRSSASRSHEPAGHRGQVLRRKAIFFDQSIVCTGLPVKVHQTVALHRRWAMLAEDLGNRAAQPTDDRVFFGRHDEAGLFGRSHDAL